MPARTQTPPRPPTPSVPSITTFSLSTVKAGVIWAATNNGVVQMTADGGATWKNVSPPDLPANGAFEIIEAGRHDAATAYATLIVPQDVRPYVYRTQDGGATWQKIIGGLPDTAFARVVREDPVRKGLLFCGTESAVHVSFDAGDHWQSLQLNLPASSMRDLWIHGEDLVLGTYGRSLWILDNITPLRQLGADARSTDVRLFEPAPAIRARWDVNGDTPLPVEVPDGAESAGRRGHRLRAAGDPRRRDHADDHRRARNGGAPVHVHRSARIDASRERAGLLVRPAPGAHEEPRAEPLRLEPAISESEDPAVRLLRRAAGLRRVHARRPRHPGPDAARPARRTARRAGHVHRRAVGRRQERSPDAPRPARSARARIPGRSRRHSSSSGRASPTRWP